MVFIWYSFTSLVVILHPADYDAKLILPGPVGLSQIQAPFFRNPQAC